MKYSSVNRGFPAGNPIANIFVIIVGALVIGASIVLGFFAFMIIGSIVLIMASIIGLRVWWFKRKFRKSPSVAGSLPLVRCQRGQPQDVGARYVGESGLLGRGGQSFQITEPVRSDPPLEQPPG